MSKIKKKRGSKSARKSGRAFQFGHNLELMQIEWLQSASLKVETPVKEIVSRILWVALMVFGNKSIVSNRVESVNSEFKLIIPNRGMQNDRHISNRIKRLVQLKNIVSITSSLKIETPISARLGFNNLMNFLEPNIDNIEFRKEVIDI